MFLNNEYGFETKVIHSGHKPLECPDCPMKTPMISPTNSERNDDFMVNNLFSKKF